MSGLPAVSSHGSTVRMEQGVSVSPGSWWMLTVDWQRMEAGEILLATDVAFVDGEAHSLTVLCPPHRISSVESALRHGIGGWTVLVEEWLRIAKPIQQEEALAKRARDMQDVMERAQAIELGAGVIQEKLNEVLTARTPNFMLSAPNSEYRTDRLVLASTESVMATEKANALQKMTTELTEQLQRAGVERSRVALFATERAQAAIAAAKPIMQVAKRLQEGVRTTSFYLGADCEVETLVDGRGANPGEPLVLMQRRLFMDEETLLHIEEGGLSVDNVQSFAELLSQDTALVNRIFAYPRAVIVASWRRNPMEYGLREGASVGETIAHALFAADRNERNTRPFLMVRDGERIHRIALPEDFKGLDRLFPSSEDLDKAYTKRGWYGEPPVIIGPDSLEYAKASENFRTLSLLYSRVLTVLWGLQDRSSLLGDFPQDFQNLGLVNPRFQSECMRFVYDDQNVLGEGRPSYRDWFQSRNAYLRPGCWVLVNWRVAMTDVTAPGAVKRGNNHETWFTANPLQRFSIVRTRSDNGQIVVDCPVKKDSWRSEREFMARVQLLGGGNMDGRWAYLVLDDVEADDVDYYLNSREARVDYQSYILLLVEARNFVRARDERENPLFVDIMNAVDSAGLKPPAGGWNSAIRRVMTDYRMASRSGELPELGSPDWIVAKKAMFTTLWKLAGADDEMEKFRMYAEENALSPIALTTDSSSRSILYVVDNPPDGWELDWPFMRRLVMKKSRKGEISKVSENVQPKSMKSLKSETLIGQYADIPVSSHAPIGMNGPELRVLFQGLQAWMAHDAFTPNEAEIELSMNELNEKGKYVVRPLIAELVGWRIMFSQRESGIEVLLKTKDALSALYARDERGKECAELLTRRWYSRKDEQVAKLREGTAYAAMNFYRMTVTSYKQLADAVGAGGLISKSGLDKIVYMPIKTLEEWKEVYSREREGVKIHLVSKEV